MKNTAQGKTHRVHPRQLWSAVRDDLSQRRQVRTQYRELQRELASFTTQASVDDLLGTIEGQQGAEVDMIRSILANNLTRQRTHQLAS
jgi:hypothetical protein